MSQDLAGRTISRVEDMSEYGGTRLHFTDGTYAELEGGGYETSEVTVQHFTPEQHRRRALKQQGRRERQRIQRLTQQPSHHPMPDMAPLIRDLWTREDAFQRTSPLLEMLRGTPNVTVSTGTVLPHEH